MSLAMICVRYKRPLGRWSELIAYLIYHVNDPDLNPVCFHLAKEELEFTSPVLGPLSRSIPSLISFFICLMHFLDFAIIARDRSKVSLNVYKECSNRYRQANASFSK